MEIKISQAERMLNLLALLVSSRQPLTLKRIRHQLAGQYPAGDSAARASFERDKGELRKLGVPIEMVTLGGDEAGEGAYIVERRSFELGDLGLTDEELDALQMAVATVRLGATFGEEALWKLGGERALDVPATSVHLPLDDDNAAALASGVLERRLLTFRYNGEGRVVQPYGLLARNGSWYLIGFDQLRGDKRVFRVDRVEGAIVASESAAFELPENFDPSRAVPTEQEMLAEGNGEADVATVRVDGVLASRVAGELGEAAIIRTLDDGSMEFAVPCRNVSAFRTWVLAMVDRAEVLEPESVRTHLIEWLTDLERAG
jgi:predicted DNA-binding transcriptional regulator YafY